jgi:transcriptional regulator with XRE-family HTH domain/ABC-type transporter Mla MlaB component
VVKYPFSVRESGVGTSVPDDDHESPLIAEEQATSGSRHAVVCARRVRRRALDQGLTQEETVRAIAACCPLTLLAAWRLARGWTLRQAADRLNQLRLTDGSGASRITPQMLCSWEQDRVIPTVVNANQLCRLYGTGPDRLGLVRDYSPWAARQETAPPYPVPVTGPCGPCGPCGPSGPRVVAPRRPDAPSSVIHQEGQLRVSVMADPPGLWLAGTIERANCAGLRAVLRRHLAGQRGDVHVDLSGLEFIDLAGLRLLAEIARELPGRRLWVEHPAPLLYKVSLLAGWEVSNLVRLPSFSGQDELA